MNTPIARYVSANTAPMAMDIGNTPTDTSELHTGPTECNWKKCYDEFIEIPFEFLGKEHGAARN